MKQLTLLAVILATTLTSFAQAQLRIVDYNTAGIGNQSAITTVFQAIRDSSVNGVTRPIDAILLQELGTGDITTIVNILNAQGNGTYAAGNVGSTTGGGSVGLVYRTETLDLIAQSQVVNTSTSGAARGVMRYTLRPDGYDAAANFYIYGSHYKASDTTSDANRRNVEATAIRANADALGEGAHIIYAGDFNIYRSSEPMWTTLTDDDGPGQAFDPLGQVGNWHDNAAFKGVHTQNPAGSGGVGGGMDDRFDWQMITGELDDEEGMSILDGSYQAFGNNNTHTLNGHINTGTGASATVLNALGNASDHLPVVAQYQVPAKMQFQTTSVASQVLVGASLSTTATVTNSAGDGIIVQTALGADELDYSLQGTGAASGLFDGTDSAFGSGNNHLVSLTTSTAGNKSATVTATATSPQVPNSVQAQSINYAVIDHANPSFSTLSDLNSISFDFGTVTLGSLIPTINFEIANLLGTVGFTSDLEHDGLSFVGDAGIFTTGLENHLSLLCRKPSPAS